MWCHFARAACYCNVKLLFKVTSPLIQLFEQSYRELRPRAPIPEFKVAFYHFANINNTIRLREGKVLVRLSDLLEGAPESVLLLRIAVRCYPFLSP